MSLGVPSIQELVLCFEGLVRVGERKFEKCYLLVVGKWYSMQQKYQMYTKEQFQWMSLHTWGCLLQEVIVQIHQ